MSTQPTYRPDIDGLRALAVLAVVLYHFDVRRLGGGYVGVDVFFVISGYLITGLSLREIQQNGRVDFAAFYERRIRRLFPALFVTIAATAMAGVILLSPTALQDLGRSALASVVGFANVYFWLQSGYFDTSSLEKPLLHMWSLGVEEQFYMVWPIGLLLISRLAPMWRGAVFAFIFVASLIACIYVMRGFPGMPFLTDPLAEGPSIAFYLTPFRGFEFIAGAVLFLVPPPTNRMAAEVSTALGLVLIGFAILTFSDGTVFPSYNALIPSLGAAMAIYGARTSTAGAVLRAKPVVWVGAISYSLYLVHWPIVVFYQYVRPTPIEAVDTLALLALALAVAALMYRFVERPFRHKGGRLYFRRKQVFAGAAVGVTLSLAFTVASAGGMSWRFPDLAIAMLPESAYGGEDCPFPGCEVGNEEVPILVLGDSFGRQLYAGLTTEFPDQHFIFRDQRTCSTWSLQWARWTDETEPKTCLSERQFVLDHLAAGRPIILANHWGIREVFDATILEASGDLVRRTVRAPYQFAADEVSRIATSTGAQVLVVANPPATNSIGKLEQCILRSPGSKCAVIPMVAVQSRRSFADEARAKGLRVIDPYDALCDDEGCHTYDSRGFFYSDEYHLSRRGSLEVVSRFRDQFSAYIGAANSSGSP